MKLFIAVLAIIASFSVCAREEYGTYEDNPTKSFDASSLVYNDIRIHWERVENGKVLEACNNLRKKYNLPSTSNQMNGCTVWVQTECTIITEKETTMHTLGHEIRHCFQQAWH